MSLQNRIKIPALGRPFSLGMLYDCKNDQLIPGMTLWDPADLQMDTMRKDKTSTTNKILYETSSTAKFKCLDISANVKASILGGMVEISGGASYLNQEQSSANSVSVAHYYSKASYFENLTMKHLGKGNVSYPDVFETTDATHVVVGIEYGGDAFLNFEAFIEESETKEKIKEHLEAVAKISLVKIEGNTSLKSEDTTKNFTERIQVTFAGDVDMGKMFPSDVKGAVQLFSEVPGRMGEGVPKGVWLHPLSALDNQAQRLVRHITDDTIDRVEEYINHLTHARLVVSDLLKRARFHYISVQLGKCLELLKRCDYKLRSRLKKLLPNIRGGEGEEQQVLELLNHFQTSPFNTKSLEKWVENKHREVGLLKIYQDELEKFTFATTPEEMDKYTSVSEWKYVIALSFNIPEEDPMLSAQKEFMETDETKELSLDSEPWFEIKSIFQKNRSAISEFKKMQALYEADKTICPGKVKFLVSENVGQEDEPGFQIYSILEGGDPVPFCAPGPPIIKKVARNKEPRSVTIELEASEVGKAHVVGYEVQMHIASTNEWKKVKTTAKDETCITVHQLAPPFGKLFRVAALSGPFRCEFSDLDGPVRLQQNPFRLSHSWPVLLFPFVVPLTYNRTPENGTP